MKFKQTNLQDVKHLFAPGTKMSTVQWEEGLRELKQIKKPKEHPDKGKQEKAAVKPKK
jgi:hypothetical protein